jgi:hypothetical protein
MVYMSMQAFEDISDSSANEQVSHWTGHKRYDVE